MTVALTFFAVALSSGVSAAPVGHSDDFAIGRLEPFTNKLPRCLSRFSDYPPGPGKLGFPRCLFETPFPANPDFWLKDVDFSCVSPWNDSYGRLRAGTAISKRHILFAAHFPLSKGTRIAFVGNTGEPSHYSIKEAKAVEGTDAMIGLLDYELTPDVNPAKVLPEGFEKWLKDGTKWPIVTFDQHERVTLSEMTFQWVEKRKRMLTSNLRPTDPLWKKFNFAIVGGDSGNPAFLLYKGHPILFYCLSTGGAGCGPFVHQHRPGMQKVMDELCPGYKLECFDFDGAVEISEGRK